MGHHTVDHHVLEAEDHLDSEREAGGVVACREVETLCRTIRIGLLLDDDGARQIFDMTVDLVQTSCGMAVPFFDYAGEREQLNDWALKKGEYGIKEYWLEKNQVSVDGKSTYISEKNV